MKWSPKQAEALARISKWLKSGEKRFALGGYAGTGKTTFAKQIAQDFDGVVKFCAFTGKAASVLRAKGCPGATTIHKLIYTPVGDSRGAEIKELERLIVAEQAKAEPDKSLLDVWHRDLARLRSESRAMFEKQKECEIQEADLVIIDESSMVDRQIGRDLESFGVPILYLGDPGQLPPVRGKPHLAPDDYDFILDEIHRQAKESPILWLAHEVRKGNPMPMGRLDEDVQVLPKREWDIDHVLQADQVITGMNRSRHAITRKMRERLGYTRVFPESDDKIICCKNNHEAGVLNGVHGRILDASLRGQVLFADIEYDGTLMKDQILNPGLFQENYSRRTFFPNADGILDFDYGYCVTGHKSQGSQWEHVVVADDHMNAMSPETRNKWLYTVVTRAERKLTYYL